jgi:pSer/pThr/pTyr-binding forkhead associated (FHA) protein
MRTTHLPALRFPVSPSLWASGRFVLRVHELDNPSGPRLVEVHRPYAMIGRAPGADVVIDDQSVSARHAYLHLDRRGVFAVDLATQDGTRIGPHGRLADWIRPGDALEIAGRHIEIAALNIDDPDPADCPVHDPLGDALDNSCVHVTLYPLDGGTPLVLHSELVFAGRSPACGVRVDDPAAAQVQCVLVRTTESAYVVDLLGRNTRLNDRPLRDPAPLHDDDVLAIGQARFTCRIRDPEEAQALAHAHGRSHPHADWPGTGIPEPHGYAHAPGSQESVLAWLMGALQATQGELIRRQAEFHHEVVQALRGLQRDQSDSLSLQLERAEALQHELAELHDEIQRRFGPPAPAPPAPKPPLPRALQPPASTPLPDDAGSTAAWLMQRIEKIHQENLAARGELKHGRGK